MWFYHSVPRWKILEGQSTMLSSLFLPKSVLLRVPLSSPRFSPPVPLIGPVSRLGHTPDPHTNVSTLFSSSGPISFLQQGKKDPRTPSPRYNTIKYSMTSLWTIPLNIDFTPGWMRRTTKPWRRQLRLGFHWLRKRSTSRLRSKVLYGL